ncbi:3-ketoacyl-ACP reductase FabG2 [Candidatus Rariloculus sp.]|uniref:3-ketoacyl-ACP reductase FabG2 n=1 Tax=Candidatus Rariloculus sp. TaxID=3101265 RepID=UPI003D13CA64
MDRTVLVTGASKGIGAQVACSLAERGFAVVVHYHSDGKNAAATLSHVESAGSSGRLLQFDVRDRETCRQVIARDIEAHGAYYGVVSNAGITRDNAFPLLTDDDWDDVLRTDLDSFYNVLKPCVMPMIRLKQGGRIVVLSSVSGVLGNRGQVNYCAAKAGVIGASKALALELAKRRITVNCVAPGLIETGMISEINLEHALKLIPLRRVGTPGEVAELVSFLMSDQAGYITRQVVRIDGGLS